MTKTTPVLLALVLLVTSGCVSTVRYALLGGRDHATTEGEARFEERDEGGYTMDVSMDRLPTAERLDLPSVHFLVWTRRHGSTTSTRIGELTLDPATRTGHAVGVVESRRVEVLITAEVSADATEPEGTVIVHSVLDGES